MKEKTDYDNYLCERALPLSSESLKGVVTKKILGALPQSPSFPL